MSQPVYDVPICPDCHHRASMRSGDPAYCYCHCHDVADVAATLLAACKDARTTVEQLAELTGKLLLPVADLQTRVRIGTTLTVLAAAIAAAEDRIPF